jgi:hypothetical protein
MMMLRNTCAGSQGPNDLIDPVSPISRNFGRKTLKWPHNKSLNGRKNLRRIFFADLSKKWSNFFKFCSSHKNLDYLLK